MLGPFGLGLGHGRTWPLTFLAKLALHNNMMTEPRKEAESPLLAAGPQDSAHGIVVAISQVKPSEVAMAPL